MIPTVTATTDDLQSDFDVVTEVQQPSKTYCMRLNNMRVQGLTDGQKAMKQAIFKILQTERYRYPQIYSDNYGVELWELIGQPIPYVLPEIKRRITEALTWDERITAVDNFDFVVDKSKVHVTFTAHTIFGDLDEETAVSI